MLAEQAPARSPYGAFPEVIERDWIGRWCHLSRADLDLVDRRRSNTTRLGFAIQLVTVRAIGTFLAEPSDVPELVVRSVAEQIGAHDIGVLGGYGKLAAQWHHVTEIRERYGYQDFNRPGRPVSDRAVAVSHRVGVRYWAVGSVRCCPSQTPR